MGVRARKGGGGEGGRAGWTCSSLVRHLEGVDMALCRKSDDIHSRGIVNFLVCNGQLALQEGIPKSNVENLQQIVDSWDIAATYKVLSFKLSSTASYSDVAGKRLSNLNMRGVLVWWLRPCLFLQQCTQSRSRVPT